MQTDLSTHAGGVGPALRRAREERGVSLSEVAQATRILPRYLQALEDDAPLDEFPAPVYARFFLGEFARCLEMDERPLMEAFDAAVGPAETDLVPVAELEGPRRWPGRVLMAGALAFMVLITVLSVGSKDRPSRTNAPAQTTPISGAQAASTERGAAVSTRPRPRTEVLVTVAVRAACRVRAVADGTVVLSRTLQPGERASLRANRRLELTLWNGPGVVVRVDGRTVPTSSSVTHLTLRLRNGQVVVS